MATIINNPPERGSDSSGAGVVIGIVVAVLLLALFFIYALPALRGSGHSTTVNVPDKINVNVNKGQY